MRVAPLLGPLLVLVIGCSGRSLAEDPPYQPASAGEGGTSGRMGDAGTSVPRGGAGAEMNGVSGAAGTPRGGGGGASAGGQPGIAAGPGWLPIAFGEAAAEMVAAATEYAREICRAGLCVTDEDPALLRCTQVELHNFAPSLEWLACASRLPGIDNAFRVAANGFRACAAAAKAEGCGLSIGCLDVMTPSAPDCPSWQSRPFTCPNGESYDLRCDGDVEGPDCTDGYDERNCDPAAERYECADGALVAWQAVCDGAEDCSDGVDEYLCAAGE